MVEQSEQTHNTYSTEQIPCWMCVIVMSKEKIVVNQVNVKPQIRNQIDPVEETLEKFDSIWRNNEFYSELEREPCNANIFDIIQQCRQFFFLC